MTGLPDRFFIVQKKYFPDSTCYTNSPLDRASRINERYYFTEQNLRPIQ